MTDLPSFFNRVDFVGKYLPGYVLVVSYVVLFQSHLIFDAEAKLDVDLLTALIFIVAGPALGYTITHFHRSLPYIRNSIFVSDLATERLKNKFIWRYAKLRLLLTSSEKEELDLAEAEYDFATSTGIVFSILIIFLIYYSVILNMSSVILNPNTFQFVIVLFIILVVCLFANAHYQFRKSVEPLIVTMLRKYKI